MRMRVDILALAAALVALLCTAAVAEPPSSSRTTARPWHEGISEDSKRVADALAAEGLALHGQLQWSAAAEKYQEALQHWPDHPEIHFNLGRAQDKLARSLEAYESLKRALRWGESGLPLREEYALARSIQARLLRDELARIEVHCDVPGAVVNLGGEPWFAGPGTREKVVVAGVYEIEATRRGYHPVAQSISVLAGKQAVMKLRMEVDRGVMYRRRWPAWVPWSVLGAGAVLGATGGGLRLLSRRTFASYDRQLDSLCGDGCTLEEQKRHDGTLQRAKLEQNVSTVLLGMAGAALFTGTAMMIFNRPEPYREEYRDSNRWQITPLVSPGQVGASVSVDF